jgi:hypothetical protein
LSDHEFLVLERENRGIGGDNPSGADPILAASGLKRIYRIDISGATDVSGISLRGTNGLTTPAIPGNPDPAINIIPVAKTPFIDLRREILDAGLPLPEKIEGITFGPQLSNGKFAFIVGTDNDFSVTQAGAVVGGGGAILPVQYEIYKSGTNLRFTPLDNPNVSYVNITNAAGADYLVDQGPVPAGYEPLPSYLYSFAAVPEPSTGMLLLVGTGFGVGYRFARRRRKLR